MHGAGCRVQGVGCRVKGVDLEEGVVGFSERGKVLTLPNPREREFFIDNLLVRIHYIIVMIM